MVLIYNKKTPCVLGLSYVSVDALLHEFVIWLLWLNHLGVEAFFKGIFGSYLWILVTFVVVVSSEESWGILIHSDHQHLIMMLGNCLHASMSGIMLSSNVLICKIFYYNAEYSFKV
ncbi:hypothetical protein AQUCO_04000090v1 [Aquilegia coerulea]|uniref:Uncharacterized protein n=1 Tax=Aquilegia coerulea TaxID=218851 RepID=A0A2G5CR89_AQUCA|nr:hypothetical protein AQUCO_04000090v1 [Aquilegia coerulea]